MNSKRNQRLLSSILLALSLSSNISFNNKIANALFESYKSGERENINILISNIEKIESENNSDTAGNSSESEEKIKKIRNAYSQLLTILKDILEHRKDDTNNSNLKRSLNSCNVLLKNINKEIKHNKIQNDFEFLTNVKNVHKNIDILANRVRGGHFSVWKKKLYNALNDLNTSLESYCGGNYISLISSQNNKIINEKLEIKKQNKDLVKIKEVNNNDNSDKSNINIGELIKRCYESGQSSNVVSFSLPIGFSLVNKDTEQKKKILTGYCKKAFKDINNFKQECENDASINICDNGFYYFGLTSLDKILKGEKLIEGADRSYDDESNILVLSFKTVSSEIILFYPQQQEGQAEMFAVYENCTEKLHIYGVEVA